MARRWILESKPWRFNKGCKTKEGKERVSRNALKHGRYAKKRVPKEEPNNRSIKPVLMLVFFIAMLVVSTYMVGILFGFNVPLAGTTTLSLYVGLLASSRNRSPSNSHKDL